jgi:hypothetical protein
MKLDKEQMKVEWVREITFVPSLKVWITTGEVLDMPRNIAENCIVQGYAVKAGKAPSLSHAA